MIGTWNDLMLDSSTYLEIGWHSLRNGSDVKWKSAHGSRHGENTYLSAVN